MLICLSALLQPLQAQTNCAYTSSLSDGYSVSISNVTANTNGSYTITLTVVNNGCVGCKKLNSFLVQAAPGTYSNVSVQVLSGAFTWANIAMGPNLSGTTLTGFRINNANGMGNGQAAAFALTYTVTTLQNQQILLKTSSSTLSTSFSIANFQSVLSCLNPPPPQVIFPYFDPYANKSYDIIGVELTSLYNKYANGGSSISDNIFQIIGTSVRISIRTKPGQHANAVSLLTGPSYGLVQELSDPANNLINGTFPILNLLSLNQLPTLLVSARPIYAAITNAGLITSQGDTALRSFRARTAFGVDGTGIKVGVLSDSYNTKLGDPASDDVLKKDLPGLTNPDHPTPVQVLQDYPFGSRSDEGRAMLQIVHDVAPGAELAFRTGFLGAVDFANGIRALQQAGCDVIVDDISYISEPMFRDGVVAQAVNEVKALGVTYFSAAGNFGTNSWQGAFAPVAAPAGVVGQAHDFDPGAGTDIYQSIKLYQGEYTIVFQWDDGTPGTATSSDFDIYLANTSGSTLFGFNRMNVGGDAFEVLPFVVTADSVLSNILIVRETGSAPALLKYIVYRGKLKVNEYSTLSASTISGQANAEGAIAVGAVLYTNTPEYGVAIPTPASFSSRGGTPVNGANRFKPDLCAPNGVNTSVDLGGVNYDGDAFPNFFGTSAAAPHAAGVAALLQDARNKYYGNQLTPDQLKGLLQNTAVDMGTPGYDVATGAGYILADSALMGLANPAPYIYDISYDTSLTPGQDTLILTVYGEYLTDSSTIWLDGVPLNTGVVIQGDTAIITVVNPFTGLYPTIQVYNPPMAGTNGTDGGLSNPLYFTTKETILVTIDNAQKTYGEVLPTFTATYARVNTGGSTPLAAAGLPQYEVDRILDIGLTTIANAQSNVGLWAITTDPADPLSPASTVPATDTLDISLLQRYNFVVDDGLLTITPAELTITPRDTTFVYGQPITGLQFDYVFNDGSSGVFDMAPSDSIAILNAVKSTHGTALVNATGLVRGTALVNNNGDQLLNDSLLNNFSFMISQAVTSTRGTALVNGELVDPAELYLAATTMTNSTSRSTRGTALVNGYTLVRGTALVNTVDTLGNITNTSSLTNANTLVNSSGQLNPTTITLNSNTQTLVILGDGDIKILSGDSVGNVIIRSVNLITGNTVGTHLSIPGTFLTNNFNVHYGLGNITILPDTVTFTIDPNTLLQTYDGTPRTVGITADPDSVDYTVTYNGSTTPPVNAGTYTVIVTVADSNYVGSATATLVVQQAPVQFTIAPNTLTQTYNGTPRVLGVTASPSSAPFTVTYNGNTSAPVNAGTYAVVVSVSDPNYIGSATATLVVQQAPAQVTIAPGSLTQVYDGSARAVTVTTNPSGVAFAVAYNGSATPPVNAGTYPVVVTVTDPNYTGSASGTLVVQKATVQITFTTSTLTQTYNASPRTVGVTVNPAGVPFTLTYNGSTTAPTNAGSYPVLVNVNTANYTGSASATLVVQKAPATVSTGIYVINKGAALPTFTATYSGFLNGQTSSVVTSLTFQLSPNYTGQAGVYTITPVAVAQNYTFTPVTGTLYVNPAGPGTKQVKPNFICYQVLTAPLPGGYTHVAYFNYENANSTPVYIPVGPLNAFSGSQRDASQQPVLFLPGTSAPIAVPYMGGSLTWQITSNKNTGGTGSIPANNSNVVCTSPGVRTLWTEEPVAAEVRVYPNPSSGQVFVELPEELIEGATLEVYNALGVKCPARIEATSATRFSIDLAGFGTGMYIINVIQGDRMESRRVVIE
ncbi:MAG: S8 family serine peptidase [Flavobacteriales bacterium]|nr:S8 family serine peptidase [Flavobacteriales bacterium]